MKAEGAYVTRMNKWLIPMAILGATAAMMAAGLFWLVLTRPIAVAQAMGQAF